jgi:hypothetical protein
MPTATFRKRANVARCKRHGLVLVDGEQCALCKKTGSARTTSPWIVASLGGVVLAVLFGVRWLDRDDPDDAPGRAAAAGRPSPTLTTKVERARPAFERVPARSQRTTSSEPATLPVSEPAPSSDEQSTSGAELPAEDRLLGQPAPLPASPEKRPRPPEAPGARGFPSSPREDDPNDFE